MQIGFMSILAWSRVICGAKLLIFKQTDFRVKISWVMWCEIDCNNFMIKGWFDWICIWFTCHWYLSKTNIRLEPHPHTWLAAKQTIPCLCSSKDASGQDSAALGLGLTRVFQETLKSLFKYEIVALSLIYGWCIHIVNI